MVNYTSDQTLKDKVQNMLVNIKARIMIFVDIYNVSVLNVKKVLQYTKIKFLKTYVVNLQVIMIFNSTVNHAISNVIQNNKAINKR